jgi:lysophospholipase L1-like esterase
MCRNSLLFLLFLSSSLVGFSQMDTILIDFGSPVNLSPLPWNNVTQPNGGHIPNLVNNFGFPTGASLTITDRFNSYNSFGTSTPSSSLGYPPSATVDVFFGNAAEFSGLTLPAAKVLLSGLDPLKLYTLEIFASRSNTGNLQTKYILQGSTVDSLFLDVHNNTATVVSATLTPDSSGSIIITASKGPDNNNAYGFYYLGAMKVIYPHVPPVNPPSLKLVTPNGGEYWQIGKSPKIIWESESIYDLVIEYTTGIGVPWIFVDSVKAYQQPYYWTIPGPPSKFCFVRISSGALDDISDMHFEIAYDTATCPVVVLGSSTAAGSGASNADSAWVNRFRNNLSQSNTRFTVTNLAKGGYTTYHILPNGTTIPPHITIEPDTARNITKALALNPYAVIINMPSNDASNNFPTKDQLANFHLIHDAAINVGARVWICTPQPRNFSNPAQVQIQRDVTDSIVAQFSPYTIDFWNGMADVSGFILSQYDSGDGIHLNDAGHRELFRRVWESRIDTPGCAPYSGIISSELRNNLALNVFPNPFREQLTLQLETSLPGSLDLHLFDLHGRLLMTDHRELPVPGSQQIILNPDLPQNRAPGMVCLLATFRDELGNISRRLVKLVVDE